MKLGKRLEASSIQHDIDTFDDMNYIYIYIYIYIYNPLNDI